MDKDIAISVKNVSKTFRIPHEKVSSVKGAVVSAFSHNKGYEEFKALDDVSFEVKKGEFFGIIGRNGSGKSTLLKILAGIYQADSGKVEINGMISPFLELGIGFNPELSGRDNVYLNATVLGMTKKEIDEKFDDIVKFSELERFIDQKLKNYSSGMQVRLAFSVSIHANREILLMDEVLAVGDSNFQSKCLEEFGRYREMGKTVILVSHDIYTIQKYCSRALLMRNGNIVKIGKSSEVVAEYINENIADEERRVTVSKSVDILDNTNSDNKVASVLDVKFFDKNGHEKAVFETGELLNVQVNYKINNKIKDPIFGIMIRDAIKNSVFGINTQLKKIETGVVSNGTKSVSFLINNYFSSGEYSVSPAITTNELKIIDWNDDMKYFIIINREFTSNAIADFESNIRIL